MSQDFAASIFLTSVLGTVLIPSSYCFIRNLSSLSKSSKLFISFLILLLLSGFILSLNNLLQSEKPKQPFDPYEILGVTLTSTDKEIKNSFRELSKKYHPDKNPDENEKYLLITKAYETLTDPRAKANFEQYGSPDGPTGFRVIFN